MLAGMLLASPLHAERAVDRSLQMRLFVDQDDDDDDGVPDVRASHPKGRALTDVRWLKPERRAGSVFEIDKIEGHAVRAVADGNVVTEAELSKPRRARRVGLQGVRAGKARVRLSGIQIEADVVELVAVDSGGRRVDLATSHASITRSLPADLVPPESDQKDLDSLSWLMIGPSGTLPERAKVVSTRPNGVTLDAIDAIPLNTTTCPNGTGVEFECRSTPSIRATVDEIDRSHPESSARSLRAEVGGRIAVHIDDTKAASIRVGGPRTSALGPLGRFRSRVRLRVVRLAPSGSVPVGGDLRGAIELAKDELRTASAIWGQCGIHFGSGGAGEVEVVDPPPSHLLALGCDLAFPASGGQLAFKVGKKQFKLPMRAGQTPTQLASEVVQALSAAGLRGVISANARIVPGALRSVDVLVRKADGTPASVELLGNAPLSTDKTLGVCLGEVDLSDGLTHFNDFDAVAGTVEERTLIKAYEDGDPTTIEILVIPAFARSGRIGESFIYADGASVRNVVILDRAGVRAGARSFALAHELGHILLDMPGHPDDFGVDQPSSLMDADAADPTIFGPRRLSVAECERAIRQSGPDAPVPLLMPWPLYKQR
jgi:hypothetical protein